jgi:hypothetical protein
VNVVRDALAVIGGLTVLAISGVTAWVLAAFRAERRRRRVHEDERIAEAVRRESPEGATAGDPVWPGFLTDHGLNGKTPRKWRP